MMASLFFNALIKKKLHLLQKIRKTLYTFFLFYIRITEFGPTEPKFLRYQSNLPSQIFLN